jgi:hypothetical protein
MTNLRVIYATFILEKRPFTIIILWHVDPLLGAIRKQQQRKDVFCAIRAEML